MPTASTPTQAQPRRQVNGAGGIRATQNGTNSSAGSGRGRGGRDAGSRRGRGGRSGGPTTSQSPIPPATARSALGVRGKFGAHLTENVSDAQRAGDAQTAVEKQGGSPDEKEAVEAEVCFICASPVVHNAVSPCNHRTCHICALRLRALYKTKACAHCRVSSRGTSRILSSC